MKFRVLVLCLSLLALGVLLAQASGVIQLPRTGQTTSYGAGDDGARQAGVALPTPRFTNNNDGTVTDNLTGLVWLRNANCFGQQLWAAALTSSNTLATGACGLSDGSAAGDWRLPNQAELMSLVDLSQMEPALSAGHPFTNVELDRGYWSSTSHAEYEGYFNGAWYVAMADGNESPNSKTGVWPLYVWPVRNAIASNPGTPVATGSNISVQPLSAVSLTFANVTNGGTVTVTSNPNPPAAPANFRLISGASYQIATTAGYTGTITLSFGYDPSAVSNPSDVKMMHYNGQSWDNITTSVDTQNHKVYGTTTSLSPFALMEPILPAPTITGTPAATATVGTVYSFTPTATNAASFSYTGTLPPGLNFSTLTGALTGTPTTAGTYGNIAITATNATGSASLAACTITVSSPVGGGGGGGGTRVPVMDGWWLLPGVMAGLGLLSRRRKE